MRCPPKGMHVCCPPPPQGMLFSTTGDKLVLVSNNIIWVDFQEMCRRFLAGDASPISVTPQKTVSYRPLQLPVLPFSVTYIPAFYLQFSPMKTFLTCSARAVQPCRLHMILILYSGVFIINNTKKTSSKSDSCAIRFRASGFYFSISKKDRSCIAARYCKIPRDKI